MTSETQRVVDETYRLAVQENLKKHLKTPQEWARITEISQEAAERIDAEKAAFYATFEARLTEARAVVVREQAQRGLHLTRDGAQPPPPSASEVERVAHARVYHDHEKRNAAIRQDEMHGLEALRNDVRAREAREAHARDVRQDPARDAFNRTNQISPYQAKPRGRSGPSQD